MGSSPNPPPPPPHPPSFPGHPSGPSLPHTPPASPNQRPQACPPSIRTVPSSGPPPPPAQRRQSRVPETDMHPIDKSWGQLFDANGKATKRLGQVLRGLASYLVSGPRSTSACAYALGLTSLRSHRLQPRRAPSLLLAYYLPSTRGSPRTTTPTPILVSSLLTLIAIGRMS